LMERIGFHIFHRWDKKAFERVIRMSGFDIVYSDLILSNPAPECLLIARRSDRCG